MNIYYLHNIDKFNEDPKKTWKFLNRQIGKDVGLSKDLITVDGLVITSKSEKIDIFNTFFFESVLNIRTKITQLEDDDINSFGSFFHFTTQFDFRYFKKFCCK